MDLSSLWQIILPSKCNVKPRGEVSHRGPDIHRVSLSTSKDWQVGAGGKGCVHGTSWNRSGAQCDDSWHSYSQAG